MYRRQQNGKHQLVVPETLIQDVIRENHDPIFGTPRNTENLQLSLI